MKPNFKNVTNFFFLQKLRRAQVIVDWLEHNARKEVEELQIKVPAPSTTGWENTLAKLLGKIDTRSTDIVTNLDPDAPLRQKKNLHELDHRLDFLLVHGRWAGSDNLKKSKPKNSSK